MEIETFKLAKFIREKIDHLSVKKLQFEKMKKRDGDEEFNLARELAHDSICYAITRLEKDFKEL